ncbi:hypothetical protein GCM10009127_13530 [Alteraurantiacibacter aestuarii]|uniref:Uncharacterized protein n=1 Tax=Alteraurantiacibacter aestuarii TaxID=650004 RepID=A0A844ZLS2_9SPHN|nr:hypothetical protein [Alteraurantiacibacter aestuarii]MXO88056.1 hypothetical protein [Alteraurantiacibacter aestuarii]
MSLPNQVIRRELHIAAQGSGRPADQTSSVTRVGDDYHGDTVTIAGPGKGHHDWREWPAFGGVQTERGQQSRIDETMRELVAAHRRGDDEIHLSGHSRGAANQILAAQILHHRGLICPDTGEQVRPPGVTVHSLNLADTVPEMGKGHMTVETAEGRRNVPYEHKDAAIPPNVLRVNNYVAGGEERLRFRDLPIQASSSTAVQTHIVPNAVHSDVGGTPGFQKDAGDLVVSHAVQSLGQQYPGQFGTGGVMAAGAYNAALRRQQQRQPAPGLVEQGIGLVTGTQQRQFPLTAQPLGFRDEDEESVVSGEH